MKVCSVAWLFCFLSLAGCAGTFRNRIVLPLAGNADPMGAEDCDRSCRLGHDEDDLAYLKCLLACPGARLAHNTTCFSAEVPASAICRVTDDEIVDRSVSAEKSEGSSVLGSILGGIVTAAVVGAVSGIGKSSESKASQNSGNAPVESAGNTTAPANQNTPGPMTSPPATTSVPHKPATPSIDSSRTPAQPTKGK